MTADNRSAATPTAARENGLARGAILRVVLLYAVLAAVWMLLSDQLVVRFFHDPASVSLASALKGSLFVGVTSLLLYVLLRRHSRRLAAEMAGQQAGSWPEADETGGPRSQIPLVALLGGVIAAALTAGVVAYTFDIEKKTAVARLQAVADLKAREIAHWLNERESDARFVQTSRYWFGLYRRWREGGDASSRDQLLGRLEEYRKTQGFDRALLLDERGEPLWDSEGGPLAVDPALRAAARQAAAENRTGRLGPHRDASGRVHLDFIAPLPATDGVPGPIVVLGVYAERYLYPALRTWPVPSASGESLLFRRDGDAVLFLNDVRFGRDTAVKLRVPLTATHVLAVQAAVGKIKLGETVGGTDYRGAPSIGVVRAVPGTNWFLVAKMDKSELYAGAFRDSALIGLAGLLLLFSGGVMFFLYRQRQQIDFTRRVGRAQGERVRLHEQLARVAASVPGLIYSFRLRPDGKLGMPYASPALREIYGFEPSDVKDDASPVIERIHPDDIGYFRESVAESARDLTLWHSTFRWQHPSKGEIWVEGQSSPQREADGSVLWHGFIQDVTQRKRNEDILKRERGFVKTLIQTLPDLVWLKDPEGVYLACNPRFERCYGAREAGIVGRTDYDFVDRELADFFREKDRAAIAAGGPSANEEELIFADDGHRELVETIKTPMHDAQGQLIGVLGISRDITAAHRDREALREERDRSQRYLDTVQTLIVALDAEGRITMINRWGRELLGYEESELLTRKWFETCLPQPSGMAEVYPLFQRIMAGDLHSAEHYENPVQCRDGRQRHIAWSSATLADGEGRIVGILSSGDDITARKRDEAALALEARRAEAMLQLPQAAEQLGEAEFMQRGMELAEDLTASEIAFIHFVHDDEETIELVTWSRRTLGYYCKAAYDSHYPVSRAGIWADALRERRAVMFNDYAAYPHKHGLPEGHAELRRLISVPVIENGKVVMLTGVGNKAADYTDLDLRTVELVSDLIWRLVQRRRAVQALRESEATYRSLFDNMLNGFAYCRMLFENGEPVDFIYLSANEAFESLTGLKNVVGRKVTEVIPGIREADPKLFEIYSRVAVGGQPERFEIYLESLRMWFSISVYCPKLEHFVAVFERHHPTQGGGGCAQEQ